MILEILKDFFGTHKNNVYPKEINYRNCPEVMEDIKETLAKLIEANGYIHNRRRLNKETNKKERPWDEECDCSTRVQKIMDAEYDAHNYARIFEFLLNEYFHHDVYSWREIIRVEYNQHYGTIHVKQPVTRRISKDDPRLSVLKDEINSVRFRNGICTDLVYKSNLLDFTL